MNRTTKPRYFLVAFLSGCAMASAQPSAPATRHRADWLHEARWGVFTHYLSGTVAQGDKTTVDEWNRLIDAFDVAALAEQLADVGARYYFITLGQNSGFYIAPNATYDKFVGITPSKCARRDLVSDLHDALAPKGIRLCVYLPSGAPDRDKIAVAKLGWKRGNYAVYRGKRPESVQRNRDLIGFQQKWEQIVADWSRRWGKKVVGWWFDGAYYPYEMYLLPDPPNFASLAAAARAGNPDSIVAFNPGVIGQGHPGRRPDRELITQTEHEDYTAGEVMGEMIQCHGRWVDHAQFHILSHLGERWGGGRPRFTDRWAIEYVREINHNGGAVTWDIPAHPAGIIPEPYFSQLRAIGEGLKRPRSQVPPGNLACCKPTKLMDLPGKKLLWVNASKHFARHGVDGDPTTLALAGGEWPWTYHVDLLETVKVDRVVVTFPKGHYPTEYKIVVSTGGKDDWRTVAHETNAKAGRHEHALSPTPARYVRVQGIKPDGAHQPGGQMGIAELEVYGRGRGK